MPDDKQQLFQEHVNRYVTALNVGKPDRVPIRPMFSEFSARYAGYSLQDVYYNLDKNYASVDKVLQDFDMDAVMAPACLWWATLHDAVGNRYLKFAGRSLEPNRQFQFVESDYMKPDDYDAFIADPTRWILTSYLPRINSEFEQPGSFRSSAALIKGGAGMVIQNAQMMQAYGRWAQEYGVPPGFTGMSKAPFDTLGDTLRGLNGIMMDLRQRPDKVLAATEVLVAHNIYYGMTTAGGDTTFPLFMPLHRGSFPFLNPKQWTNFYWPSLKKVIEGLWALGKRTLFYAEGNWTPYLEQIAELPDKSIVFHVDMTDIARAKQVLGGRFCLSGNVPVTLLSYGKPAEVRDYCKKLIAEVASDGGFIMDAAGVMFADARDENVRAMIETTREYGVY